MISLLRRMGSYGLRVTVGMLLLVALYVSAGRLLMPMVPAQKDTIESRLSEFLGARVQIASLRGDWWRFSPVVALRGLEIRPETGTVEDREPHRLDSVRLRLDVPRSLLRLRPVVALADVRGPDIALEEIEGRWRLAGVGTGNEYYTEQILDFLLTTGSMEVSDARVALYSEAAGQVPLRRGQVRLKNRRDSHRIEMRFALGDQLNPLRFRLEARGDPENGMQGMGYLRFSGADISPLLSLLGRPGGLERLSGSAELWAGFDAGGLNEFHGRLDGLGARATPGEPAVDLAVSRASGRVSALRPAAGRWRLRLSGMAFDWRGQRWEPGNLYMQLDGLGTDAAPSVDLRADRIDLGIVRDMLLTSGLLPAQGRDILSQLNPAGHLTNVFLHGDLSESSSDGFNLRANLEDVAVDAWQAAPAGRGITGYLEMNRHSGFVELDTDDFELHLPLIFADSWHYDSANARVSWRVTEDRIRINSSVIDVRNEDIHGRVRFGLVNTRNAQGGWDSDISLMVGVLEMDAAVKSRYLPTLAGVSGPMDWLDRALAAGQVHSSGLIFRGATSGSPPPAARTVQGFFNFREAELAFLPDWPRLGDAEGFVQVDNAQVDIHTDSATIAGIRLDPADATIRPAPDAPGAWLEVLGGATGADTDRGLAFLQTSPASRQVGGFLDDWQASGVVDIGLALRIPLGGAGRETDIQVDVTSDGSTLDIPAYDLHFEEIRGRFNYTSGTGLRADGLSARLFDFPVAVTFAPFDTSGESGQGPGGTLIRATGRASRDALSAWPGHREVGRMLLARAAGEAGYQANVRLYDAPTADGVRSRFTLTSDLNGLAIDLPRPFNKAADTSRPLELDIVNRTAGRQRLTVRLGEELYCHLLLADGRVASGLINFGPLNRDFTFRRLSEDESGVLLTGDIERLDVDAWSAVAQTYGLDRTGDLAGGLRLVDVEIGRLTALGHELADVNTQVRRSGDGWNVFLENEKISGFFGFPAAAEDRPWEIRLDYLRLDKRLEGAAEDEDTGGAGAADILADLDPASLPAMEFSTGEFSVGDTELGSWRFSLSPRPDGVRVSNLRVEMTDGSLTGIEGESGAALDWRTDRGAHSTALEGLFQAGDLARVLSALGYDANIESESARIQGRLTWPGSPAAFSLAAATGEMSLDIDDGRFVDIEAGSSRLFGALSFDAIVRRLQLDFSDLYQRGFTYDTIDGTLNFNRGIVTTDGNMRIEGPSSRIVIDGSINLPEQTIQADMLVNIPLSQNISVLAGILGAWPLAVSTYVAGKIFEDQVDDFTTVVYRLEGPWEDPEAGFEPPEEVAVTGNGDAESGENQDTEQGNVN